VLALLAAVGIFLLVTTVYQLTGYLRLPVDLLSFSESPYVNDILKLRLGVPIYSRPEDNDSYPYTPGSQILTYLIAAGCGQGESISFYRLVQFLYVILASLVAVSLCDLLARGLLSAWEYRYRPLWVTVWVPFLFLLATEPRFNLYTHSLHNDGLALLVSVAAFWLIVRHSFAPRPWLLAAMTVLPALGFLVKQNQLMWAGVFLFYLLTVKGVSWRQFVLVVLGQVGLVMAVIGACYLLWGEPFVYWIFRGLGDKQVSVLRSIQHLLQAGMYVLMGLAAAWVIVLRDSSRKALILWTCWLIVFGIEAYTSGIGYVSNHLGPGVVLAGCWLFVALVRVWPTAANAASRGERRLREMMAAAGIILLFGALGLVREPVNPVPADFSRYVAAIEAEFHGADPAKVLLDNGTWIYFRHNILMKDRSAPVSLHVGKNQPQINHAMLAATIRRIEDQTYDKILAHQLDTDQSAYDFQDRGSGVKAAMLTHYQIVRRIPGVRGIQHWWPKHMVADIVVLVPRAESGTTVAPGVTAVDLSQSDQAR
jgi:hypothetical protein